MGSTFFVIELGEVLVMVMRNRVIRKWNFCMFEGTELVLEVCVLKHGRENYTEGLQMYFAFYNTSTMNKYKTDRFRCIVQHNLMKSKTIVKMETDYLCF